MQPSIQASPQQPTFQSDATSKLQLMNLKAAAQKGGLDAASTGWAILEKLGTETDHGAEWNEVWHAISAGKATLLLPLEAHNASEPITPEFIKDHIAFWDSSSRDAPVVTLSGMRGTMAEEALTLRSSVDISSKVFKAILDPTSRNTALNSLPPLPVPAFLRQPSLPPTPQSPPLPIPLSPKPPPSTPTYPVYSLTSHHPSLPLPPRPHATNAATQNKPPLPPRPRPGASTTPAPASRLSNPFASLFGRQATPTPPASPTTNPSPLQVPQVSSPTDVQSPDGTEHVLGVPAFTLNKRIVRRNVAKDVLRVVHHEVRAGLAPSSAPSWVAERIEEFAERESLLPFIKAKGSRNKLEDNTLGGYLILPGLSKDESVDDVGQRFQDFYAEIEEQLIKRKWRGRRAFGKNVLHHLNGSISSISSSVDSVSGDEKEDAKDDEETERESDGEEKPEDETEKKIRAVVEAAERTICSVFYDRLFMQSFTDDAIHDEALSSRIAAVNLLDLTLGHLGVDVGDSADAVEAVVRACGQTLTQLDLTCRAPADKAAILVAAHKILVDGLSRLPPIKLKPEDEILDDKTPRAHTFGRRTTEEEEDDEPKSALDAPSGTILHDSPTVVLSPESETPENVPFSNAPDARGTDDEKDDGASLRAHAPSPRLTISPPPPTTPTPVSGDVILPLMIFAVVKANPPHLVSHLLYTQRFRNQTIGGEESYCLINLMAVAEFLENVDLAALGLGESEKNVISTAELTPITLNRPGSQTSTALAANATLRGRVEQQVDAIAGSANKVISGVVDSSFGVLRAFLPGTQPDGTAADADSEAQPRFTLLRRDTAFSIASLAASLPGASIRSKTPVLSHEEAGQQLVEVPSRPASIRSTRAPSSSEDDSEDEDEEGDDEEEEEHDARSIRSFESMMSSRSRDRRRRKKIANANAHGRKSLADRLASVPGLARLSGGAAHDTSKVSPPASRRSSLLVPGQVPAPPNRFDTPVSSRAASPVAIRISPPNPRFLEATADDIRVSEVGELLKEYRRMVEAVRAMGGFHQD
ncbi:vacuolar sorting protein 9 (VPS9) domain-containing protein [Phanerochaete sordida]|uniref:Vacuolar sorting protein 9 (VPS9) domain-containing protein n=1 Tax=Phanerochaete sordida TaxID=48140 RepID=A0A9P3G6T4_9APHY|nr:vacuolar sorting protein 9 (VPS9) domain-containing protein [Phanerochaete sordida]